MTAIIVDDEIKSHEVLKSLLSKKHADVQVLASGFSVQEGYELIQKHHPDLVFLDVEMPDGQGFDLLKKFEIPDFSVVFITAHQDYAVTAFQFGALHFLLKPIDSLQLVVALDRALKEKHLRLMEEQLKQRQIFQEQLQIFWETLERLNERKLPSRISISTLDGIMLRSVSDIIHLKAKENYTEFTFTNTNRTILASVNIGSYEDQFKPYKEFMRVHRSSIVNLTYVDTYVRGEGGQLIMKNGDTINVARRYKDELLARLNL